MRCSMSLEWRLAALLLVLALDLCVCCPSFCSCKWKNGKQTVECINKDLLVIPESMDSGTQVLEFCGNNLQTLHKDKFLKMGLINLQRIYLCRCRIAIVDDRTFKGLTNLVELDLAGNQIEAIPTETFLDCPSLMRLILSSNPIKTVRKSAFNHLDYLSTLELSGCEISTVDEGAFNGLYKLEWLHLDGNKLTTLQGSKFLPGSLKGVQLHDNPWQCDCHMLELHAWLQAFTIPHSAEPICNGPSRLQGRPIKSVPLGDLACLPEVTPTVFYLEIGEGKNITLACKVHAIPEAHISWTFQGQLLQNDSLLSPGLHLLYFLEDGTVDKHSELFIYNLNTNDNGTFICNAENPAGGGQANFTIRIVVKHEPSHTNTELPFEFVLITMSAAAVSIVLLLLVCTLSIIKCRKNTRLKKKRASSKVTLSNSTKDNLIQQDGSVEEYSDYKEVKEEDAMLYTTATPQTVEDLRVPRPIPSGLINTPYQIERNPDLINGTESVGRFMEERDLYVFAPDVRLNPITLLEPAQNFTCYKTLPYRACKRSSAANPAGRFSREAEFLSATNPYEHYGDVRHTADGYPVRLHSPKAPQFAQECCSSGVAGAWPPGILKTEKVKSVAAQTDQNTKLHDALENLDEGYEGENGDTQQSSC